jgi:hypothetical protein
MLSSDQLKFLIENNAKRLVDQYLNTGNPIHKEDLPLLDNQQTRTYLRRRNMMYDHYTKQYTDYNNEFNVKKMLLKLNDDQFIDEVFFENLLKDGASKTLLLNKIAELNYKYDGYDSIIDRLLNENLTPRELNTITWSLLDIGNTKILEKFFEKHREQLQRIENENLLLNKRYVANHNLMNYLYDTINKQLFVKPASESMVFDKNYEGYIDALIKDGYADELMESLLFFWDYDLTPQIDYLLEKGASLEKAWNIVSNEDGVNKHTRGHLYILMKEKHPKYIEEWMKEKDPTLRPKFDPEKYINKLNTPDADETSDPPADETSDPPKDTLAFNLNKYLMKSGKYYVV